MRRRFFVERFEGDRAALEGEAAHHLSRVLRGQPGQLYDLSDGERVWLGKIESVAEDRVSFRLLEPIAVRPDSLNTSLLLSVVKFDAFEWALEKAAELGVRRVVPLAAGRSEKALLAAAEKRSPRWRKILFEAAQQSRRLSVPILGELEKPSTAFAGFPEADARILLSERAQAPSLRSVLRGRPAKSIVMAVGPEGGWLDQEHAAADKAGFLPASMGDLILRTETAVIAALASVNYELRD